MTPEYAGKLCDDLDHCLRAEVNLEGLAAMIRVVLRKEAWRERRIRTGQIVRHDRFIDFLTHPPLEGLGEDPERIQKLIRDDDDTLTMFSKAIVGPHGGDRTNAKGIKNDNIILAPKPELGTSRSYSLRRLEKDRPDLHADVLAEKLTPHAAMIAAGFRRRKVSIEPTVDGLYHAAQKYLSADDLYLLLDRLHHVGQTR